MTPAFPLFFVDIGYQFLYHRLISLRQHAMAQIKNVSSFRIYFSEHVINGMCERLSRSKQHCRIEIPLNGFISDVLLRLADTDSPIDSYDLAIDI